MRLSVKERENENERKRYRRRWNSGIVKLNWNEQEMKARVNKNRETVNRG